LLEGGLLNGYSIRWLGTKYNQAAEKAEHRRHRYLVLNVVVRDVTDKETLMLMGATHRTPFLWSEMAGKDYLAQMAFPIEATVEAFEYLREIIRPFGRRASHYVVDQKNSVQFVLPYNLWSDSDKDWTFEKEGTLARFENLVLKIKNEAGTTN
jgi:hypothetical protein